ncbi:MAG: biotin--[acetyl-CoA-carboxylase] ligase [Oscillospiraceae bacterium]|nr:biotin--[acetyl-CoA-carboxylase] ligase [Oscillospiraceae bacterium]
MNTKQEILALLESGRGAWLSGEALAGRLGVSRSAVWKAVSALTAEGHRIEAVTRRGYRLAPDSDVVSRASLLPHLNDPSYAREVHVHAVLDSTNAKAKALALAGHRHGTVVVADTQTAGRGRLGRSFASPAGAGLYISFLLEPGRLPLRSLTWITAVAALAVCDAVKLVTGRDARIKWVNDVLLDNRKICGILTEALTNLEGGGADWLVVGIGINVLSSALPEDLRGVAAGLYGDAAPGGTRSRLAASLINTFLAPRLWPDERELHAAYRARQVVLGREVTVHSSEDSYPARAVDLDADGHLIVERPDGRRETLCSGEVSVKL